MAFNIGRRKRNIAVIVTLAAMVVLAAIIASLTLQFSIIENLVMSWVLTACYSVFAFWMVGEPIRTIKVEKPVIKKVPIQIPIENKTIEVIETPVEVPIQIPIENKTIEVIETPVEVPIQIPIENKTIEVVEKPVIQRVEVPVLIKEKFNFPKFKYTGSSQTKTFHKRNCRFGKMIKKEYRVQNNYFAWFEINDFKPCKACMK